MYYSTALTDEQYDLLIARGEEIPLEIEYQDISLMLHLFPCGASKEKADAFTAKLNRWRERYGKPEIDTSKFDNDELYDHFAARNYRRDVINGLIIILGFIVLICFWIYR